MDKQRTCRRQETRSKIELVDMLLCTCRYFSNFFMETCYFCTINYLKKTVCVIPFVGPWLSLSQYENIHRHKLTSLTESIMSTLTQTSHRLSPNVPWTPVPPPLRHITLDNVLPFISWADVFILHCWFDRSLVTQINSHPHLFSSSSWLSSSTLSRSAASTRERNWSSFASISTAY